MNELRCLQCKRLGFRPQSYCKPFCKMNGMDIIVNVCEQKPNWCPKEVRDLKNEGM